MSAATPVPPAELAAHCLAGLAAAAADPGLAGDAAFRSAMMLIGTERADLLASLTPAAQQDFRDRLFDALLAQLPRLRCAVVEALQIARSCEAHQFWTLCQRRSAIQFLIDDYPDSPVAAALGAEHLRTLDEFLSSVVATFGPVEADEVPDAMPDGHWWWFEPQLGNDSVSPDSDSSLHGEDEDARIAVARAQALVIAEALRAQLEPMLRALHEDPTGAVLDALRPQPGDCARVFAPQLVPEAEAVFDLLWKDAPKVSRASASSRLEIHVAPAGMLSEDNELSRQFPGGYRRLAPYLLPHRVWVVWKLIEAGQSSGVAYDGLVWVDDRWVWFPKPFRALRAALDAVAGIGATLAG